MSSVIRFWYASRRVSRTFGCRVVYSLSAPFARPVILPHTASRSGSGDHLVRRSRSARATAGKPDLRAHRSLFAIAYREGGEITGGAMILIAGYILFGVGLLISLVGDAMLVRVAYQRSLFWFFGCLFVPVIPWLFPLAQSEGDLEAGG